jgi:hypothetical protein
MDSFVAFTQADSRQFPPGRPAGSSGLRDMAGSAGRDPRGIFARQPATAKGACLEHYSGLRSCVSACGRTQPERKHRGCLPARRQPARQPLPCVPAQTIQRTTSSPRSRMSFDERPTMMRNAPGSMTGRSSASSMVSCSGRIVNATSRDSPGASWMRSKPASSCTGARARPGHRASRVAPTRRLHACSFELVDSHINGKGPPRRRWRLAHESPMIDMQAAKRGLEPAAKTDRRDAHALMEPDTSVPTARLTADRPLPARKDSR